MKKFLIPLFILVPLFAFSQQNSWEGRGISGTVLNDTLTKSTPKSGYESFFGNNSWEYAMAHYVTLYSNEYNPNLLSVLTENYKFSTDNFIFINNEKYFKSENIYLGNLLLREDTINGRLYTKIDDANSEEILLCDMSLDVNDTFVLHTPWLYGTFTTTMIVDSVSYINSKKQIHLSADDYHLFLGMTENEDFSSDYNLSLRFMEGIGPIYGIYPEVSLSTGDLLHLLLCLHKDDTLTYMTHPDLGCFQQHVGIADNPQPEFNVFPNPANDLLHVTFPDAQEINGKIIVRDAVGRVCYQNLSVTQTDITVNVANFTNGVYFISFFDENNRAITKKFVKM